MPYTLSIKDRVVTVENIDDIEDSYDIFFEHMDVYLEEIASEAVEKVFTDFEESEMYCGDPAGLETICGQWFDDAEKQLIKDHGDNICISLEGDRGVSKNICMHVSDVLEHYFGEERWQINSGKLVILLVTNFLKLGKWQAGFRDREGKILSTEHFNNCYQNSKSDWTDEYGNQIEPLIWFGIDDEPPIQSWTIDKSEFQLQERTFHGLNEVTKCVQWEAFWHSCFWQLDWETLIPFGYGVMTTWMFAECGMDEPQKEFTEAYDTCPVDLSCESTQHLFQQIDEYFKNKI